MSVETPTHISELRARAEEAAGQDIAPYADEVDRDCRWPDHALKALAERGLMGLHVPRKLGGHGQGLLGLVVITEAIARACSSSAMCYGMHCVGTAVIAAKATRYQEERYLRPIAAGEHVTTLALSETATGAHFYLPMTKLERNGEHFIVTGSKQFVTNGAKADSYVVSTTMSGEAFDTGEFNCLILDEDQPGMAWGEPWRGVGMRGNTSRGLTLERVRVPAKNLLGDEGDEIWYVFEVVAPYFLMAMSATYLGIAQAALELSLQHLRSRRYEHSGERLADVSVLQHKVAEMWTAVEKSRHLMHHAARLGDLGSPQALPALLMTKADVADTVVAVTNQAMTLCGGIAYRENSTLARLLRDARASHVMSPTTDVLKGWAGRTLLGQPML